MNFIERVETMSNAYNFEDSAAEHGSTFQKDATRGVETQ